LWFASFEILGSMLNENKSEMLKLNGGMRTL